MEITVVTASIPERHEMLEECKASVAAQTYPAAAHLYDVDIHRVGPAWMRNRISSKVETPWITFLDDDDLLLPPHFETHAPYADDFDIIFSWADMVHSDGGRETFTSGYVPDRILAGHNTIPLTASMRTDLFRDCGGFSETERFEDWYLWKMCILKGARFACIEHVTWEYRTGHGNRNDVE